VVELKSQERATRKLSSASSVGWEGPFSGDIGFQGVSLPCVGFPCGPKSASLFSESKFGSSLPSIRCDPSRPKETIHSPKIRVARVHVARVHVARVHVARVHVARVHGAGRHSVVGLITITDAFESIAGEVKDPLDAEDGPLAFATWSARRVLAIARS
jgi:hypothetical protein